MCRDPPTSDEVGMPLTMPCGFEDTLLDFENSIALNHHQSSDDWVVEAGADFDPDPLAPLVRIESNKQDCSITTGSKTGGFSSDPAPSNWCRNSSRNNSIASAPVSSPSASAAAAASSSCSSGSSGLSSSSYCRRMGTGLSTRRSSTFQLWSPRLRMRDERKRVLKLSLTKLRQIDDAESCLRRSVLLNNTLRRLQREAREERSPLDPPRLAPSAEPESPVQCPRLAGPRGALESRGCSLNFDLPLSDMDADEAPRAGIKRRRPSDLAEEAAHSAAECGLMFNDLYLPPTPRMISSLEEEEEAWRTVESQCCTKKQKTNNSGADASGRNSNRPALRPCNSLPASGASSPPPPPASSSSAVNQNSSPVSGYQTCLTSGLSGLVSSSAQYSCGQSSLFGELQSVVFHSLITSLES